MPYARKTLTQLRNDVLQDIQSAQITDNQGTLLVGLLAKAILRVMAYAQAGLSYEHYGFLDWISLQAVPWTSTDEFLEGWAGLKGVTREPATATFGNILFSNPGSVDIPQGTLITRLADGFPYISDVDGITTSGTTTVPVLGQTLGSAGNFDANTAFALSTPIAGVPSQSIGSTQIGAGADIELDDSLRSRMLRVYAAPPQGGDLNDYIEWATAVPGVTRAWIVPNGNGAGTVLIYFMMDDAESSHEGFPQGTNGVATNEPRDTAATGDQLTLANALFPLRPVTALVYALAPAPQNINVTVNNLGTNNTPAMAALITTALNDMFLRLANVGGTVKPSDGSAWPTLDPSAFYAALEAIPGLTNFTIASPSSPITATTGELPVLGTLTTNT